MITATNPLYGKINSHLQLRVLVGCSMESPRHLGEVLDISSDLGCLQHFIAPDTEKCSVDPPAVRIFR
jgi:hypothetical protein